MSMLEKILLKHEGMKSMMGITTNPKKEEKNVEGEEVPIGKLNYDNEEDLDTAEM